MSGNISPQIPSVEAEEPKEVAKIIEEDHTKGVTENDLEVKTIIWIKLFEFIRLNKCFIIPDM